MWTDAVSTVVSLCYGAIVTVVIETFIEYEQKDLSLRGHFVYIKMVG